MTRNTGWSCSEKILQLKRCHSGSNSIHSSFVPQSDSSTSARLLSSVVVSDSSCYSNQTNLSLAFKRLYYQDWFHPRARNRYFWRRCVRTMSSNLIVVAMLVSQSLTGCGTNAQKYHFVLFCFFTPVSFSIF